MNWIVIESFRIKSGLLFEAGQVITLSEEKAAALIEAGKIQPELSEAEQEDFEERAAIIEHDASVTQEQAEEYAIGCVKPLPLVYAESCGKQTPPAGTCLAYSMRLYKPSMDLKPYCLKTDKWCYEVRS